MSPHDPKLGQALLPASETQPALWKRFLFGFWPCATALTLCTLVCVNLNVHWNATGALRFTSLTGLEAVQGRTETPLWLLLSRVICALTTTFVLLGAVCATREDAKKRGKNLHLGGLEVLCTCTLWTWVGMSLYFIQVSAVTARYQLTGSPPSPAYAAVLWVWFEVMYAMAWLVFLAVWLVLLPVAHYGGLKEAVDEMLSFWGAFSHIANLVMMQGELLLSEWTMQQEHVIFCIYFGIAYVIFNWWLYSHIGEWFYFFLDYNNAGVPSLLVLVLSIYAIFCLACSLQVS